MWYLFFKNAELEVGKKNKNASEIRLTGLLVGWMFVLLLDLAEYVIACWPAVSDRTLHSQLLHRFLWRLITNKTLGYYPPSPDTRLWQSAGPPASLTVSLLLMTVSWGTTRHQMLLFKPETCQAGREAGALTAHCSPPQPAPVGHRGRARPPLTGSVMGGVVWWLCDSGTVWWTV